MSEQEAQRIHWSFWLVGAFALIWNVMGSLNFFMQLNAETVASLPETHRAIIVGRPVWATAGFAVSVFGGALGGLLLLLKKRAASHAFVASLVGTIVTMAHTLGAVLSPVEFSLVEVVVMMWTPLVVAALLIAYARSAARKGWIG